MFAKLTGQIEVDNDSLIVNANGVGYLVHCSSKTLANLSDKTHISLYIDTHIREDAINLYGFETKTEKDAFKKLITVKGLGPKIGLAILGSMTPQQIFHSINAKDKSSFSKISGIGPKLAERIILELKDKFISNSEDIQINNISISTASKNDISEDAISALSNLGYSRSDAYMIVNKLLKDNHDISLNEIIRTSLKSLSKV